MFVRVEGVLGRQEAVLRGGRGEVGWRTESAAEEMRVEERNGEEREELRGDAGG